MLGLLDDLILVPAGLWLVLRLIPPEVLATHRAAAEAAAERPISRIAATVVILLWTALSASLLLAILARR